MLESCRSLEGLEFVHFRPEGLPPDVAFQCGLLVLVKAEMVVYFLAHDGNWPSSFWRLEIHVAEDPLSDCAEGQTARSDISESA